MSTTQFVAASEDMNTFQIVWTLLYLGKVKTTINLLYIWLYFNLTETVDYLQDMDSSMFSFVEPENPEKTTEKKLKEEKN